MTKHLRTPPDFPLQSPVGLKPPPPKSREQPSRRVWGSLLGPVVLWGHRGGQILNPFSMSLTQGPSFGGVLRGLSPPGGSSSLSQSFLVRPEGGFQQFGGGLLFCRGPVNPPPALAAPLLRPPFGTGAGDCTNQCRGVFWEAGFKSPP